MTRAVQNLTDEALVRSACGGDDPAVTELVTRYLPMIRRRASRYFLPGMEAEDVVQEGLIGLLKAIRLYDGSQSSFPVFASLCVGSTMATAAKAALSQKSRPLSDYSPLDELETSPEEPSFSPEEEIIIAEQLDELNGKIQTLLSSFEQQVLTLYLSGHSYLEISQLLRTSSKAVDNALQRVRRKLRSANETGKSTTPVVSLDTPG